MPPGRRILLFGSSSLFASFPNEAPETIGTAATLDADFFIEPDDGGLRETLDDCFGEDNAYHQAHGYYGDFVDLRLAEGFPEGWRDRLVPMPGFANVFALSPMDMAVSKVVATASSRVDRRFGRREADRGLKDIRTLVALVRASLLDLAELDRQVCRIDHAPAMIVECSQVMATVRELSAK